MLVEPVASEASHRVHAGWAGGWGVGGAGLRRAAALGSGAAHPAGGDSVSAQPAWAAGGVLKCGVHVLDDGIAVGDD